MIQLLGNVAVGSTVYLNEYGSPQPYLVVHQGLPSSMYDASCNGTWLLRQDIYTNIKWNNSGINKFSNSNISNLAFALILYGEEIYNIIKTVKIPYCVGGGGSQVNSGANGYSCKLFLLGGYEVGWTTSDNQYFPVDGAKLSYFNSGTSSTANQKRIANYSNIGAASWWLRSPLTINSSNVMSVYVTGNYSSTPSNTKIGIRPAMVMPTNLIVDDSNNITTNQLVPPSNTTVPSIAMQQQALPVSWTPVSISGIDVTYQLQRNVDNGGWTTIYTGVDTSYTDTVGTWTQVQYQVATVALGTTSDYTQSTIIPVSDPQTLVISGQDGNLGTLTSNLPYTVSSNTGNPISLTRTVNGAQVVTLTVESGFAYNIPIADLPTGTGTIQITASVEDTSQQIQTQTRTWTYYKTPINIPSTGGIAQLTQNGQNIWPVTVPDAVEAPVYLGGNLNAALNKLGQAALYTKIGSPKYNQVTVDLSKVSVGDEVLLPYNNVMIPHVVVHIGNPDPSIYDGSCNGVWLLRKDIISGVWNSSGINTFANSTIINTMQTYVENYNSEVQSAIQTVKIPYCVGGGSSTVNNLNNGLSCQMFPLSANEFNLKDWSSEDSSEGAPLDYFLTNSAMNFIGWTRTVTINNNYQALGTQKSIAPLVAANVNSNGYYRPCFIMPTTFNQTYYVDAGNGIHPSQEYTTGGSITDVFGYDVPIAQITTGSYIGTGVDASVTLPSLTFSYPPKWVAVCAKNFGNQTGTIRSWIGLFVKDSLTAIVQEFTNSGSSSLTTYGVNVNWIGNSVSWGLTGNTTASLNVANVEYQYVALG